MDLDFLLANSQNLEIFFIIIGAIIEILLMVGGYIIYKNIKEKKNGQ